MINKFSRWVFVTILILTIISIIPLKQLEFGFNLEKLYPTGDPDLAFLEDFKKKFHAEIDDEYIFIGLKNDEGVFRKDFLLKVDSLSRFMHSTKNILRVFSITQTGQIYLKNKTLEEEPLIHIQNPELYRQDSINLFQSREYRNLMMSNDGKALAISAFNKPGISKVQKDSILSGIESMIDKLDFDESHLTAKIKVEKTYVNEIERNLRVYLSIAFILISIVLFLLFRSVSGIVMPIVAIVISIVWTLALVSLLGNQVDIISSLIPPVLAVICVSNIVHVHTKYIDELRKGASRSEALSKTFHEIGLATFLAAFTTAIGFYSLYLSNVQSVKQFGFFAGCGIWIAFILAMSLMFAYYSISSTPVLAKVAKTNSWWNTILSASFMFILKHKYSVLIAYVFIVALSGYYINKIEINSSLLQEIPRNSSILEDYLFVEEEFSGTRAFEMALILKDSTGNFMNVKTLGQIEMLEQYLKDSCGIGFILSPLSFFKGAHRAYRGGSASFYTLPKKSKELKFYHQQLMMTGWAIDLLRYLTPDLKSARVSGKLPDLSSREFENLQDKIEKYKLRHNEIYDFGWKITGSATVIDKISYYLIRNMLLGLLLAFVIVAIIVLFLFRSVRMIGIAILPNLIPLTVMGGLMGFIGIYLKADTSIIFAVAFGIVLDDTIHFVSRFNSELNKGRKMIYAVKRAYLSTGKAMVFTTLILFSGFVALLFSSFGGSVNIGFLICVALIAALIVDLSLLPLLIILFYKSDR